MFALSLVTEKKVGSIVIKEVINNTSSVLSGSLLPKPKVRKRNDNKVKKQRDKVIYKLGLLLLKLDSPSIVLSIHLFLADITEMCTSTTYSFFVNYTFTPLGKTFLFCTQIDKVILVKSTAFTFDVSIVTSAISSKINPF